MSLANPTNICTTMSAKKEAVKTTEDGSDKDDDSEKEAVKTTKDDESEESESENSESDEDEGGAMESLSKSLDENRKALVKAHKIKMAGLKKQYESYKSACEVAIEAHTKKMSEFEELCEKHTHAKAEVTAMAEKLKEF